MVLYHSVTSWTVLIKDCVLLNAFVNTGKKLAEYKRGKAHEKSLKHVISNATINRKRVKMEKFKTQARPAKALLFQVTLTLMRE